MGSVPLSPSRIWDFQQLEVGGTPAGISSFAGRWLVTSSAAPRHDRALCHVSATSAPSRSAETTSSIEPDGTEPDSDQSEGTSSRSGAPQVASSRLTYGTIAVPEGAFFADVDLSAYVESVESTTETSAGLAVRIESGDTFYLAALSATDISLSLLSEGRSELLGKAAISIKGGTYHTLRIRAFGSHLTVSLDDRELIAADDTGLKWGRIGAWSATGATSCFDEIAATPY